MTDARRTSDALWFRVLDRFGLPTLLSLLLLGYVLRQGEAEQKERRELLGAIKTAVEQSTRAIEQQTLTLRDLAMAERAHADAVTATWPAVRVVSPVPHRPGGGAP